MNNNWKIKKPFKISNNGNILITNKLNDKKVYINPYTKIIYSVYSLTNIDNDFIKKSIKQYKPNYFDLQTIKNIEADIKQTIIENEFNLVPYNSWLKINFHNKIKIEIQNNSGKSTKQLYNEIKFFYFNTIFSKTIWNKYEKAIKRTKKNYPDWLKNYIIYTN